ncbi:MAG: BACON domain-containing protein [Prevotella sp.]|nr:BACON domain-containing protein [Prevotella sp.]
MRKSIFVKLSMAFALALLVGLAGCNREDIDYEQPVLEINKTQLEFDVSGVAVNNDDSFTIQTNREWSIQIPDAANDWIRISKLEGEGAQTINVTVLSNEGEPRSAKLKISASINYEYIEIIQGGTLAATPIYYENVGGTDIADNTQVDAFTGWLKSGSSASGVAYTGSARTDVRKSVQSTEKYRGASGGNNIFFGGEDNGTFEIRNIDVTGKTQLTFSFGISWQANYPAFAAIDNNTIKLSASIDGTNYTPLTFSNAATADWVLATSEFKVPGDATKLYIKFADPAAKSQIRLDDFTLVEGGNGQTVIGSGTTPPQLAFGTPAFTGTMTAGTALSGTKITVPYSNAAAESFTVNVAVSGTGAAGINAVTANAVTLGTGSGNVELDITGTPTTAGDVVFTITGLTGLTTTTVNATVQTDGGTTGGEFSAAWSMAGISGGGASPMEATSKTGSGITFGALTKENISFSGSGSPAGNAWGGNDFTVNTEDIAVSDPVKYAYFTVSSSNSFSLSTLEATIRISGTGPKKTSVQYKINNAAYVEASNVSTEITTSTGNPVSVDLSGIAALQNVASGTTVTIRLVPVKTESTASAGTWYLSGANALKITGSN